MFTFTFNDLLSKNLPDRAGKVAVIAGETQITYGELASRVEQVAAWLHRAGVRRGDRVGIHLSKSIEEVVATFAAARLGAVFVNINYQWTTHQLQYIVGDCGIRVLITDRRRAQQCLKAGALEAIEHILVHGGKLDDPRATPWSSLPAEAQAPDVTVIDTDLAALMYTSGSTGKPKGVMLTHLNIVEGARSVASYLKNTPDDRTLGLLPMSFDYGMSQLTTMFLVGGTIVLQPVIMPEEIVSTIIQHRVTGMAAVPPLWIQVVRYLHEKPAEMPSLRYITNSGGKIPESTLTAMPDVFPGTQIYLMYGLTEAFRSTYLPPELFHQKMGAIGRAIPNSEMFVVDPARGICGPGQQGELLHRGSLISRGYWGKPEATNEKIKVCEHLRHLIGDEKVLYSGDLVRMDEDGILWFIGRADCMIKCSGFRLSPTEVEEVLYKSGLIGDAIAFGVEDEEMGQVVHVAVSALGRAEVETAALEAYCRANMPHYMVPRHIHAWEGQMPRTASGKLDRPAVISSCMSQVNKVI